MIPQKELLPLTGYIHGGCSPIGMKKQFKTFIHTTAQDFDRIYFSSGRVGNQVSTSLESLQKVIDVVPADIIKENTWFFIIVVLKYQMLWGRSSAGRVPQWHCGSRGFDPLRLHQSSASIRRLRIGAFFFLLILQSEATFLKSVDKYNIAVLLHFSILRYFYLYGYYKIQRFV